RCAAHAARVEGATDGHVADARPAADPLDQEAHAVHRIEAVQRLDLCGGRALHEGDADAVRAGGHEVADVLEAVVDGGNAHGLVDVDGAQVLAVAEFGFEDLFIVYGDDQRVLIHHAPDVAATDKAGHGEFVFAIGGEVMLDDHAAARA